MRVLKIADHLLDRVPKHICYTRDLADLIDVTEESFVLILGAYFDESGHSSYSRIVSMAGWLAPPEVWDSFSKQWQIALDKEVIKVFHMADFENQKGEFSVGWEKKERRHKLLSILIETIKDHDLCGIGSAILMGDYSVSSELREERIEDAYFLNFQLCASDSVQIVGGKFKAEKVSFVFATQGEYVGRLPALYEKVRSWSNTNRFGPISFDNPRNVVPLQVADLLAYETYKFFENGIYNPHLSRKRWPYDQLQPLIIGTTFVDRGKNDISFNKDAIVISRP